nr:hypothetical protein [Luteibacter rhizovicinus]
MNPTTPPPSDDDLPDEHELAALYARLPKVEPDASLDAAVLAEAARATPVNRRPRWPVAMASAAVLVLAVGVAWQVREQQPAPRSMPPAAAPAAWPVAADKLAGKSIAAEAAPTPAAREPAVSVGAASAAKPTLRAHVARTAIPTFAAKKVLAPPPPSAPAAPPEPPEPPTPSAPASPPAPEPVTVSAAPAPAPQQPASEQYEMARPAASGMLRQTMSAPARVEADSAASLGPDDRIGEIRRLLGSGDRARALRELKDFRQRYPHYDLPQDLRDLNP